MLPTAGPAVRVAIALLMGIMLVGSASRPAQAQSSECKNLPPFINWVALQGQPWPVWNAILQLNDFIRTHHVEAPGFSVSVVFDQDVVFAAGFGCGRLPTPNAPGVPALPSAFYKIESVTKVFEALMLMQQRDRQRGGSKQFKLKQPVANRVPQAFFNVSGISGFELYFPTYLQLATHSSGLPDAIPADVTTRDQFFEFIESEVVPQNKVGKYSYSDEGFVLVGQSVTVIAEGEGGSYTDYVARNIFQPLGMTRSTYDFAQIPLARRATPYKRVGDAFVPDTQGGYQQAFPGNVITNVLEMAKVVSLQFREGSQESGAQILACQSIQRMWKPVVPTGGADGFATIGWFSLKQDEFEVISKNGGDPFWSTLVRFLPDQRLGVIAFANVGNVGDALRNLEEAIIGNLAPLLPSRRPICETP